MSASMIAESDIALFRQDLVALKRDVTSLIEHTRGGATNTVQNAANQIESGMQGFRQQAGAQGDRASKSINLFVEKRPFVALMIAVGIGYIGARLLRR
jgi:ElaB/YqjD/DUF883 family membrane-anchored ribosome-binding protein